MENLGKLEKVDVREVWKHEARDFSAWLVKDENLSLLSEELGIDIESIGTEESSGRFRVDILAKEANSGDYIIIENQLEPTNHDHLGKVITYAAGYGAKYLIWIVKDVLEEHQKAIEWLNEHLDDSISCFLIKIEVWKIGDSRPAPRFEVITLKNNWASNLKRTIADGELSPHRVNQLEFWTALVENFKSRDTQMKLQSPSAQHWLNFSMGSVISHLYLTINTKDNFISCDLWTNDKGFYSFLQSQEEEIRAELGYDFRWWEANKSACIRTIHEVNDVFNQEEYQKYFDWFYAAVKKYLEVFPEYVREYKKVISTD